MAAWKLLLNIFHWVLKAIEIGYRIQFVHRPPRFNSMVFTTGKPKTTTFVDRLIHSHRNFATTQEVPDVRFRRLSLAVSGSFIQPSLISSQIHNMDGCSTGSSVTPGHPHSELHRWLADFGPVSRACTSTLGCRPHSSQISGVETGRQEMCSLSCPEDVFGGCI